MIHTACLQVLFSSHHLGRIIKGCSNDYDSESLLYILTFINTTQLYSNLVYQECNTTYLCLVLVVLSVSQDLRGQACLAMHSAVLYHLCVVSILMHSLANVSLILILENKGGPTPGH